MTSILRNSAVRRFGVTIAPLVFLGLALRTGAHAQLPPKPASRASTVPEHKQAFEAASVRLEVPSGKDTNSPSFQGSPTQFPSNVLVMRHTMLRSLICEAYGIPCGYVMGGPEFIDRLHYDLNAKVEGDARLTQEQMQPLMQNLLEERFHLRVHREQKILPGYALIIAKGGPRLQANRGAPYGGFDAGSELKFQNVSAGHVAKLIGWAVGKPVVDHTGLAGTYDVDLKFRPAIGPYIDDPRFSNLPEIFTSVQEQLGLKLVPQKVTIDTLVVDHVDKTPTEN